MPADSTDVHDKLMTVLKRRGYLQPSYEIYGGVAGFYDYGPLGAALKTNIENLWRRFFVLGEGMAEIQCPTISPEQVFRASGHLEKFADTVIDCPACGAGNRGDHLVRNEWKRILDLAEPALKKAGAAELAGPLAKAIEAVREGADRDPSPENLARLLRGGHELGKNKGHYYAHDHGAATVTASPSGLTVAAGGKTLLSEPVRCPACQQPLDAQKAKIAAFNLMFKTTVGPGSGRAGYLRPETAQGMFMDFNWLWRFFRQQMPFGAVQLGKAYRNEISPRQSLLRLREFHQMEAEVFFDPQAKTWPGFSRLAAKELNLLSRDDALDGSPRAAAPGDPSGPRRADEIATEARRPEHPRRVKMADAVEKGVIANGALGYFIALTAEFLEAAGIPQDKLRFRQHGLQEKAHYATDTWDAEFLSPRFGWVEIVGIADRTDYDLKAHERVSGQKLRAMRRFAEPKEMEVSRFVAIPPKMGPLFKQKAAAITAALQELEAPDGPVPDPVVVEVDGEQIVVPKECYRVEKRRERVEGEWYVPHVVEPSFGVDRIFYAVLETSYYEAEWATLRLAPAVAPVKCGVFPLMAKDGMDLLALEIDRELRTNGVASQYDDGGAIGRRYARQDEVGTPYCVTVDHQSKADGTVTLRERDSGQQKRVPKERLLATLHALVAGRTTFAAIDAPTVSRSD